jgi:hypothetical protein
MSAGLFKEDLVMADLGSPLALAKERITIWELAVQNGWPLKPHKTSQRAFWRNDRVPSLSIQRDGLKWFDHGTGKGGDQINLITEVKGISNGQACAEFLALAGGQTANLKPTRFRVQPKETKPPNVPRLSRPTNEVITQIALLRSLPTENGVREAVRRDLLWYGTWNDYPDRDTPLWILTDSVRVNAQARRCDGALWKSLKDNPKSKSLRPANRDTGWPIGCGSLTAEPFVVMVEGEGDLLAAIELGCMALGPAVKEVGFCFVSGIAKGISTASLQRFCGRHVRVVPQIDRRSDKGETAATEWTNTLQAAGVSCDLFDLRGIAAASGEQLKDLGELFTWMKAGELKLEQVTAVATRLFTREP